MNDKYNNLIISPGLNTIQNAIHELPPDYKGRINLRSGIYIIDYSIKVPSNVEIIGEGEHTVIKLAKNSNCHVLTNNNLLSGNSNISISNLSIDGEMEFQERPLGSKSLVYCCGFLFRNSKKILVENINFYNIRQTAIHLGKAENVTINNINVSRVGWSGLSSSEASNVYASGSITNSGLDIVHSAIHMDGGVGISLNFHINKSTGNGFMIDSTFSSCGMVTIKGAASECKRGVSFSGSHKNKLGHAYVSGEFYNNHEAGIMISNAEAIVVTNSKIYNNGGIGILFQGKFGGSKNIIIDTQFDNNVKDIVELHSSKNNFFSKEINLSESSQIKSCFKNRELLNGHPQSIFNDSECLIPSPNIVSSKNQQANTDLTGICFTCGKQSQFSRIAQAIRESYRCSECGASLRHRAQAEAILSFFGYGRASSLKELAGEPSFRDLKIFEPGIVGPNRKILSSLPNYVNSYYWNDLSLGSYKNNVRNEDLMDLTFDDNSFDLIITSDIMEHVRKPWLAFKEIGRVLKPGAVHIFSIPVLAPLPKNTSYLVNTEDENDIFISEPRYHIAGDGSRSLVYSEFGADMFESLRNMGFITIAQKPTSTELGAGRVLTFISIKAQG